jgi:hypothetical protein
MSVQIIAIFDREVYIECEVTRADKPFKKSAPTIPKIIMKRNFWQNVHFSTFLRKLSASN